MPRTGPTPLNSLRGAIFIVLAYGLMGAMGLVLLIPALISPTIARLSVQTYIRIALVLLRILCGTRYEVRGTPPTGPCIVASKHQSFMDIWLLSVTLPKPRFVMKRSLLYLPILGIFARRMGCIAIDRDARSSAMRAMERDVLDGSTDGQIVIYPQGTRVAPGASESYKPGVLRLYQRLGQPLELVATNAGCLWPKSGIWRAPGTVVLEFLGPIEVGRDRKEVATEIEDRIETASDRLLQECTHQSIGR
ncbi:MAG: lysophospholipid acyltransferase family protein [Pseudomonadota bacterium]